MKKIILMALFATPLFGMAQQMKCRKAKHLKEKWLIFQSGYMQMGSTFGIAQMIQFLY